MSNLQHYNDVSQSAAHEAGKVLLKHLGRVAAKEKGPRDLVTQADLEAQSTIKQTLLDRFPDHGFLGEEGNSENVDAEFCWIVDPLDGTTNFVHQLPGFAVSIALMQNGEIVSGTIFDPIANECFSAIRHEGALRNGEPIQASSCTELGNSLLVCSFPSQTDRDGIEIKRFLNVMPKATVRRMGSAAMNLAYIACGRLDGYWASSLSIWDMAAGLLIATEAGASFSHIDGGPINLKDPQFVAAATPELHQQLLNEVNVR